MSKYDKKIMEALMRDHIPDRGERESAREIHELTYWKHSTGVSETAVRRAMDKVGNNRARIERELKRSRHLDY